MATKKLVPRANNEGGLGTAAKTWGASWLQNLTITNLQTSTAASILVETSGDVEKRAYSTFLPNLTTLDEGVSLTTTTSSIDFVGAGVTATVSGNDVTVTVTGAAPVADTEDATCWVGLYEAATGNLLPKTDEQLFYNALTGALYIGGTATNDSLRITKQHILAQADLLIESANLSSLSFDSTLGHMFFYGGVHGQLADLSNTGLLINNIPAEAAPTHVLVDNIADPGLVSKMALSSLPTTLITVADTEDTTCFVGLWESATGNLAPKTDEGLTYNALTGSEMLSIVGDVTIGSGAIHDDAKVISKVSNSGVVGQTLCLHAGDTNGLNSNTIGGALQLYAGLGTGNAAPARIILYSSKQTAVALDQHPVQSVASFYHVGDGTATSHNYLEITAPDNGNDYLQIEVGDHGATKLETTDQASSSATLTLKSDGDMFFNSAQHVTFQRSGATMATIESMREKTFMFALSDETSLLTTGTAKLTFRIPTAFTLEQLYINCNTAPTGAAITIDISDDGVSLFDNGTNNGVRPTIAATSKTSVGGTAHVFAQAGGAATATVDIAADSEMVVDIDTVGSTIAGKGLKLSLVGYTTV